MIDINLWLREFEEKLKSTFGQRVVFMGIQGSYGRGEATESSDIDAVVILDRLSVTDIKTYNNMLDTLPNRDLICGFLADEDTLIHWDEADLLQFYYDTSPIVGNLDGLVEKIDDLALDRAIKTGVCNIYHGCVHNMLYEKSGEIVQALYKSAVFVVQAIVFKERGKYVKQQKSLLQVAKDKDREIVSTFLCLRNGEQVDFDTMSQILFIWAKGIIWGEHND